MGNKWYKKEKYIYSKRVPLFTQMSKLCMHAVNPINELSKIGMREKKNNTNTTRCVRKLKKKCLNLTSLYYYYLVAENPSVLYVWQNKQRHGKSMQIQQDDWIWMIMFITIILLAIFCFNVLIKFHRFFFQKPH